MNILNDFNTKRLTLASLWRKNERKRILFDICLSNSLFPILFIFRMLVSLVLMPMNSGGTLIVYAKKTVHETTPDTEKSL